MLPLTTLQAWIPQISFSSWVSRGISTIAHLYAHNSIRYFSDLSISYSLQKTYLFQYLQIRHTLSSLTLPLKPVLTHPFCKFFLGQSGLSKGMSFIYQLLITPSLPSVPSNITRWEKELSAQLPYVFWVKAFSTTLKYSNASITWN